MARHHLAALLPMRPQHLHHEVPGQQHIHRCADKLLLGTSEELWMSVIGDLPTLYCQAMESKMPLECANGWQLMFEVTI